MSDNRFNSDENSSRKKDPRAQIPEAVSLVKVSVVTPFNEIPIMNKTNDSIVKPIRVRSIKEKLLTFHSEEMKTQRNSKNLFLMKLYCCFFMQYLSILVFTLSCIFSKDFKDWIKMQYLGFVISIAACFFILIIILMFYKSAKIRPWNYLIYICITIGFCFFFGYLEATNNDLSTLGFLVMFTIVSFCQLCFICLKKKEIEIRVHWKLVLASSILGFGVALSFTYKIYYSSLISLVAVICFFFFSMYDSHVISGGRFEDYTYDDYLISSQLVYIDVIGICYYLIASAFE